MKKGIVMGIVLLSSVLFSCTNEDDQDISLYNEKIELMGTGGEDEQSLPPPPPIIVVEP